MLRQQDHKDLHLNEIINIGHISICKREIPMIITSWIGVTSSMNSYAESVIVDHWSEIANRDATVTELVRI